MIVLMQQKLSSNDFKSKIIIKRVSQIVVIFTFIYIPFQTDVIILSSYIMNDDGFIIKYLSALKIYFVF
jgi:hypothetical protein